MFILLGFKTKSSKLGQENRFCPNCNRQTIHSAMEISRWFDLFFIPLFPFSRQYLLRCNLCGMEYALAKEEVRPIRATQ